MSSFVSNVVSPTELTSTQLDVVVGVAVRAYDASRLWACDFQYNRVIYGPFFEAVTRALLLEGKIWPEVLNGRIVGVLEVFGPGKFLWATKRSTPWDSMMPLLACRRKQKIGGRTFMDRRSGKNLWMEHWEKLQVLYFKGKLEGWMTPLLAVDPPYQQHGIATATFKRMTGQSHVGDIKYLNQRTKLPKLRLTTDLFFLTLARIMVTDSTSSENFEEIQ
ncbi:hypothetical protein EDD18DRAFT_1111503 [Armillaria luteobubalina]|uniref:Uncharacterized protein n=1 Tax=Armillaria luteobubalina TaxID=153913 RepID=A0AA39PKU2_9AGAR|nr:hypothetical protein EDD18DRAFT_1111503 [Armillaria luteobubalina]